MGVAEPLNAWVVTALQLGRGRNGHSVSGSQQWHSTQVTLPKNSHALDLANAKGEKPCLSPTQEILPRASITLASCVQQGRVCPRQVL